MFGRVLSRVLMLVLVQVRLKARELSQVLERPLSKPEQAELKRLKKVRTCAHSCPCDFYV